MAIHCQGKAMASTLPASCKDARINQHYVGNADAGLELPKALLLMESLKDTWKRSELGRGVWRREGNAWAPSSSLLHKEKRALGAQTPQQLLMGSWKECIFCEEVGGKEGECMKFRLLWERWSFDFPTPKSLSVLMDEQLLSFLSRDKCTLVLLAMLHAITHTEGFMSRPLNQRLQFHCTSLTWGCRSYMWYLSMLWKTHFIQMDFSVLLSIILGGRPIER